MPGNKPRSQYKKRRRDLHGVRPQEKNRTTDSDVVKKTTWLPLSRSSNTSNIDLTTNINFTARNDAKDSDKGPSINDVPN